MNNLTIVEASIKALEILNKPSSIKEIRKVIDENKLYIFGAEEKNIHSVIRNDIERCSENTNRSQTQKIKYFKRIKPNTYILLNWESNLILDSIKDKLIDFKINWFIEKEKIISILEENKKYNQILKPTLSKKEYKKQKRKIEFNQYKIHQLLCNYIPYLLEKKAYLDSQYSLVGSVGAGNISEIPWICIFDNEITKKATEGYYLVYLFKSDMSGFYLSLNQGWTQYENAFGIKEARNEIKEVTYKVQNLLKSVDNSLFTPINLIAEGTLGKGYELGNICSKYYSLDDSLDDSKLLNDLRNFIGIYKELKGYIGLDILNLKNNLTEDDYQKRSQEVKRKDLEKGPIKRKNKTTTSTANTWFRDPGISKAALENANFLCEFNAEHITFIASATGKQFVEAHHLIPMQFQNDFDVSIDVPENIISLCPNCHRAFHNAAAEEKSKYIKYFFNLREELLKTRGLKITENSLIDMYKK